MDSYELAAEIRGAAKVIRDQAVELDQLRTRVAELEAMEQRALGMLEGLPTLMSDHQAAREILGR